MIMKAAVACGSTIFTCDVVKHDGHFWLVPYWYDAVEKGYSQPARIVRITEVRHQKLIGQEHDFVLNSPMPEGVLDGSMSPQECVGLVVVDAPDIRFPTGHS